MIKSGIFIFFLHALNPSEWTDSIELGVKKELRKTGELSRFLPPDKPELK